MSVYCELESYSPPEWASHLQKIPKSRIPLILAPTPVQKWRLPRVPGPFSVWIKRDDLTGSSMSGNKVRKAEFLLAEAVEMGSDCVVTMGGVNSNSARTFALAAREIGLDSVLLALTKPSQADAKELVGESSNMLLSRLSGAEIIVCPRKQGEPPSFERYTRLFQCHMDKLKKKGRKPYKIPMGGSCPIGDWGYIRAWEELMDQKALENIDDVVVTIGSGGTACGLAIANYLTGSKLKVHGVSVTMSADLFYETLGTAFSEIGLVGVEPRELIDIIDGYVMGGYGHVGKELKELVISVASETGIILDPVYGGKAVTGMLGEMRDNPQRFRGKRILFIHTGGIFNTFSGILDDALETTPSSNHISCYTEP